MSVSAMLLAAPISSGRGSVLPIFGARTAASAPTLPLPVFSRNRPKARKPASDRISERLPTSSAPPGARKARPSADILCPPRRQKGAHVGGSERGQFLERRRAAEMAGEEAQELQHIALVSFERLGRQITLGTEVAEPILD